MAEVMAEAAMNCAYDDREFCRMYLKEAAA
jgi:hypothetical protein